MPDDTDDIELQEGTTTSTADTPIQSPPAAAQATTPTPTEATPPAAAQPNPQETSPSAATSQPAAPPQPATVREFARQHGFEGVDQYQDDASFLQAMIAANRTYAQQLAEAKRMAPFGQMWLDQQTRAAAQQQQPETAKPDPLAQFKAPEFDPRWETQITRDPTTGELKLAPGADPTILPKIYAWKQHRERISDQFLSDPVAFIKQIATTLIPEQTQQVVEQRLAAMQEQQYTDNFIATNRSWLFQHDPSGRPIVNPATNQPIPTPQGASFIRHLNYAAEVMGIKQVVHQEQYARAALAAEMQQPAIATAAAVQQGSHLTQAASQQLNRRQPSASGSFLGAEQTGHLAPTVQNGNLSLREMLMQDLQRGGFTDENIKV